MGDPRQRIYNRHRQVKVDVERYSKEQAAGAESLADVQGTGPVKR
jgi:hypothetical protein